MKLRKHKARRRQQIALTLCAVAMCAALVAYAKSGRARPAPFALASDVPRGALVYTQFSDLPTLFREWNSSALKERYLESANFKKFGESHLALKLLERWQELNDEFGFELDAEALAGASERGAAIALYDIGRLDLVVVAPLGEEQFAASRFFQGREGFEETELSDGTVYYRRDVETDRGRQKQQLVFAELRGRFVLSTSERLLLRTLANINGKAQKDRLSDDMAFRSLTEKIEPHFVSVWVDQSELNGNSYFKHYWLMRNTDELKEIRACLFDLERREGRWIERRDLLYASGTTRRVASIPGPETARLSAMIPASVPYFKLRALDGGEPQAARLVQDALLDRLDQERSASGRNWDWHFYSSTDFNDASGNESDDEWDAGGTYAYLYDDYNASIDDPHDAGLTARPEPGDNPLREETEAGLEKSLRDALAPARPLWAASLTSPQTVKGPLFAEFRRAAILTLSSPERIDRQALESSVSRAVSGRLLTAGSQANLNWTSAQEAGQTVRQLELPMLGWQFCYALKGRDLIVANSQELLRAILQGPRRAPLDAGAEMALDDITLIDLEQRSQAFDEVFERLDARAISEQRKARGESAEKGKDIKSQQFFTGNIASLLGASDGVSRIVIRRNSMADRLHEEIDFTLK